MNVSVVFMPNAPIDQMLDADVIQIDNLTLARLGRKWSIAGLGFVGGLLEPLYETEVRTRIEDAEKVSWIPDASGSTIVRGKGWMP